MHTDCFTVEELIMQDADYTNNAEPMAVEELKRLCSQSYDAYNYLQDRVHDPWIPDYARRRLREVLRHVRMQLHAFQEYGRTYPDA